MTRKDEHQKKPKPQKEDVVLVHGRTEDGEGLSVLRKRGDIISAGEVRPVREGQPLSGELVRLEPRQDAPMLADVEVLYTNEGGSEAARGGPAQVSTPAYRAGWAEVFGPKKRATKPSSSMLN